jgi:phospholipase C
MKNSSRRDFLRKSAGALGAASALTVLPASIQRALAVQAAVKTGTIQDIEHVVILMQENRSFDHYFGTLRGVRGFGDRFPIPLASGKAVWYQHDTANAKDIPPYHLNPVTTSALLVPSTPHSFKDMQGAWQQGKMDGWIPYKGQYTMGHYLREDIPFQFALAEAFTICDDYHCSILTGTDPNRITFVSGSNFNPALRKQGINSTDNDSEPNNSRCWPNPSNWVADRAQQADGTGQIDPATGAYNYKYVNNSFKWDTLPDVLEKAGITWNIYQNMNDNWTGAMHGCLAFESFRTAQPGSSIYARGMTGSGPANVTDGTDAGSRDFLTRLRQDVVNGTLPQVSWVLTTTYWSEHPGAGSSPTRAGEFVSEVLDALTANPDVWSKTVFFLTFDENDGQFDHVPPPAVPSYDSAGKLMGKSTVALDGEYFDGSVNTSTYLDIAGNDGISGTTRPWGLSARVPMYVISPWSKGGWVNSQVFDHTSMAMFLEKRFGITVDAVSPWHRAVCGDLTSCFDFANPNDPQLPAMPDMSGFAAIEAAQKLLPSPTAPDTPQPLFQETGTRPSRALPYELHTSARVGAQGVVSLIFSNTGNQGAVFHVYDKLHLDLIPRRYTVEAGKQLTDDWSAAGDSGNYELWVYSASGFVRTFKGNALATNSAAFQPEVQVCYDPAAGDAYLKVHNAGAAAGSVTVQANAYRTDGPWTLQVAAGATGQLNWSLAGSGHWYDFTVTGNNFERRFAGRIETGQPGVSDPAMALQL